MTLRERILSWFKKEEITKSEFKELEKELNIYDNIDQEDWDASTGVYSNPKEIGSKYIDKDAVEGKTVMPNLEDMISQFTGDVPGKHAIWGGKETIAFKKYKAENNWD